MRVLRELILIKEIHCPVCKAADLFVLQAPEIANRFLITRFDNNANTYMKNMVEFWRYAEQIGAEIYPTILMGYAETEYYPYTFHIWEKGKPKPVEISEEERKHLEELKDQILKIDRELDSNPLKVPQAYNEWKQTYGLKGI